MSPSRSGSAPGLVFSVFDYTRMERMRREFTHRHGPPGLIPEGFDDPSRSGRAATLAEVVGVVRVGGTVLW